jgi:hypothetical protein
MTMTALEPGTYQFEKECVYLQCALLSPGTFSPVLILSLACDVVLGWYCFNDMPWQDNDPIGIVPATTMSSEITGRKSMLDSPRLQYSAMLQVRQITAAAIRS